jgi:putative DNA primase/helicase
MAKISTAAQKSNPENWGLHVNPEDTLLDGVLEYAEGGIPVFPCNPDKKPVTAHGFKDATTDERQIRAWWQKWPRAMIGIPTGVKSGIDVLDLDVKPEEYIDGHEFVPNWADLSPIVVETPSGGHHVYFQSEGKVRCSTDAIAPGVDTRGEGGYVIAAPSRNKDGEYLKLCLGFEELPRFPTELLEKLGSQYVGPGGAEPEADPKLIAAAMKVIPNTDLGWDEWKKFGMAIWRATGGTSEGFAIFDEWSRKSAKYDANNTRREWDAITRSPPSRIGAGTIFYHANAADPTWTTVILPTGAPVPAAEAFIRAYYLKEEAQLLRYYRGAFYRWTGTHYREYFDEDLESDLYKFLNVALTRGRDGAVKPYNPTKTKVAEIVHALKRGCLIQREWRTPCWLGSDEEYRPADDLVACRNGILNVKTRELRPHDPSFFTINCMPLDYDPGAPKPTRWLQFLEELWPTLNQERHYDHEAEQTLQEIFGYLLTPDTSQQKIFLVIGPPRGGKGTIAHVLERLLGEENCVFPTLASMSGEFGKWPLIDKKLAIITDARIGSNADTHRIAELLLSISGGDKQTINRKNQPFWTGHLYVRFLITTNVLPAIRDSSGTIATRYILLKLTESFLGREDLTLKDALASEMGGILNWALDGLDRLRERGYFQMPTSSQESIRELEDAAEPLRGFLREWCTCDPNASVNVKALYQTYRAWAEDAGQKIMARAWFGRALRDQIPTLTTSEVGQRRIYVGVGLSEYGQKRFDALMDEKGRGR